MYSILIKLFDKFFFIFSCIDSITSLSLKSSIKHIPFDKFFELSLSKKTLSLPSIPSPPASAAADAGGDGIDGKLRVFLESDNSKNLSNGMCLIDDLRDKDVIESIQEKIKKNLSNSFIRIEYISDRKGFWLKPHLDIKEKLMTMMLFINTYDESEKLGTDFYDTDMNLVKTVPYKHNTGYFFASGNNTWHGLEKKEIKVERRCMQINYVTFPTSWPING